MRNLNQILKSYTEELELNPWEVVCVLNSSVVTEREYVDFINNVEKVDKYDAFIVNQHVYDNTDKFKEVAEIYYKEFVDEEEFEIEEDERDYYDEEESYMYPEISETLEKLRELANVDEYLEEVEKDMEYEKFEKEYAALKRVKVTVYETETELIDTVNCNIVEVPLLDLKAIINSRFTIKDVIIDIAIESIEDIYMKLSVEVEGEEHVNEVSLGQLIEDGMAVCVSYKTDELELSPIEFRGLVTEASDVEAHLVIHNASVCE